jgi:hypothetical protein
MRSTFRAKSAIRDRPAKGTSRGQDETGHAGSRAPYDFLKYKVPNMYRQPGFGGHLAHRAAFGVSDETGGLSAQGTGRSLGRSSTPYPTGIGSVSSSDRCAAMNFRPGSR